MTTATPTFSPLETLLRTLQKGSSAPCGSFLYEGLTIHYNDRASLYTAFKDIFEQKIYHFEAVSARPLVIDGGAHIGVATLYWKQLYPRARVVCFEPDEAIAEVLRRNISINGLEDVEIVEAGLSDSAGEIGFVSDGADGGRVASRNDAALPHHIRTVRLSDQIREPVDLLKLNIEGQEWPVLCDLEQTGKIAQVRRIVLEYHGWPGGAQCLGDILNLLDRAGYRYIIHDFDRETNPATKPPFKIRVHAPWFCLVYAERPGAANGNYAKSDEAKLSRVTPVNMGELRRVTPVSRMFGLDRGTPVDRYYIEKFLTRHLSDIRGRVLEIGEATYTRRFGAERVARSDVLHATEGNRHATIVGDLASGTGIPEGTFDCVILTQTLLCIEDVRSAIENSARALARGGVLLATVPGISQISRYDMERWGDWWRFTSHSAKRLFEDVFGTGNVTVEVHGNVLAATAFLQGMAVEELTPGELDHHDPDYELVISICARKPD